MLGARVVPGMSVDRARLRSTLAYRFTPEFAAGIEWNPIADDLGIVANWLVLDETATRPALVVGTSSDRIGTEHGRSFYATLSKDLEDVVHAPVAPYAGVSWGQAEDELALIGGLAIRWSERVTSYHTYDGRNLHHLVETSFGAHTVGLLLVDLDGSYHAGVTYSFAFSMPWER